MKQQRLWVDTLPSAIDELVEASGGAKAVGCELRPGMDPEDAAKWLKHCLTDTRREKLSAADLIKLLQLGRRKGCHVLAAFVSEQTGYEEPRPSEIQTEMQRVAQDIGLLHAKAQRRVERLTQLQALLGDTNA